MERILGLDLGTNSIGWAITEHNDEQFTLIDKGVDIFQEGVNRTKNGEEPMVKVRTVARGIRRHYYRRRLRKIELLKVLIKNDMCPFITHDELEAWRYKKIYPMNEEFLSWQRTDDETKKNPYYDRYQVLTEELDLSVKENRYILGRALYHLAQRRGFLSNRKNISTSEDGVVKGAINELNKDMEKAGCSYLGEFYYKLYCDGKKIRTGEGYGYAGRIIHYEKEFNAICEKQKLSNELRESLYRAIFFQRALKSQKGTIGMCTFEKNKRRCPISHPRFEEFRMHSFINNIRMRGPQDTELRMLTKQEKEVIKPLFYRKSKEHFDFEEIAKKLSGNKKGLYSSVTDNIDTAYIFNFKMSHTVFGCPMITSLRAIFGDHWLQTICSLYVKNESKEQEQILNDVWHVLFSFDNDDMLFEWAKKNLQLNDELAEAFVKIPVKQGYASLSLCAINKILPWLHMGYRYDEAVYIANLSGIVPSPMWDNLDKRNSIISDICILLDNYSQNPKLFNTTKMKAIADILMDNYGIDYNMSARLYEPSKIDTYAKIQPNENGLYQLGSPRISSVRNPMAMRALYRLRALINQLLKEGKINRQTKINIEFARGLNDANMRNAIEKYQNENSKNHQKYAEKICELYKAEVKRDIVPTEEDILKYKLWEEQKHICLYTGKQIKITDFIGVNPLYDIEHTVPRSRGGDNSQMNKTLCFWDFNRNSKKAKLPSELSNHSEIMARIEQLGWENEIKRLETQLEGCKRSAKSAQTKDAKDKAITDRHFVKLKLDYLRGKLFRFKMIDIPTGFSNRQGIDIGIIGKYAKMYLETVFDKVFTVKGATTADFRKMWGLQDEYSKKERANYVHHCIDAITIACISSGSYIKWAQYQKETEYYDWYKGKRPEVVKPWNTFTEDIKAIEKELLISHYTANKLPKHTRKKVRIRGRVQLNKNGNIKYAQGDTARGVLHQQSFYGAIKYNEEIKYVIRKSLNSLTTSDVDKIVDDAVRDCVKTAINRDGFKEAMSKPICFNPDKGVYIKKVRIFTPGVTNPIHLKKQRDLSRFDYKRDFHVANDSNYCMAIYEGVVNGRIKRIATVVNNLDAVRYYNNKSDLEYLTSPFKDGLPLKYILRIGTMVLFYEQSSNELYNCPKTDLVKRLYKVVKMQKDGRITFKFHQEARNDDALNKSYEQEYGEKAPKALTKGYSMIDFKNPHPILLLSPTNMNFMIEGYDFDLSITGGIVFKNNKQ